jgi:hypothetical protein
MNEVESNPTELQDSVQRLTAVIERQLAQQRNWKLMLRNGVLAGLGGVIGATVVVSILIAVLQPFKRLQAVGSMFDRLETTLKQSNKR